MSTIVFYSYMNFNFCVLHVLSSLGLVRLQTVSDIVLCEALFTMKLWHWISRVTPKNLETKETSNAENFSVWSKNFHCDFSVLEQQRKIFQWDNPELSLWFPL